MSKEKIIVHVECPTGHLSHAVNVRRDKEPPAQLGGGRRLRGGGNGYNMLYFHH